MRHEVKTDPDRAKCQHVTPRNYRRYSNYPADYTHRFWLLAACCKNDTARARQTRSIRTHSRSIRDRIPPRIVGVDATLSIDAMHQASPTTTAKRGLASRSDVQTASRPATYKRRPKGRRRLNVRTHRPRGARVCADYTHRSPTDHQTIHSRKTPEQTRQTNGRKTCPFRCFSSRSHALRPKYCGGSNPLAPLISSCRSRSWRSPSRRSPR